MEQEFTEFSEFRESDKSLKHELGQFKDPIAHICLAGAVVASWSLTQRGGRFESFTVMINIFVSEFSQFIENI